MKNWVKKGLLITLFGIVMFLINGIDAKADISEKICHYNLETGTLDIYVWNWNKDYYSDAMECDYKFTPSVSRLSCDRTKNNPCYTANIEDTLAVAVKKFYWDFQFDGKTKSHTCPTLSYKVVIAETYDDVTTDTFYDKVTSVSTDTKKYDKTISSSIYPAPTPKTDPSPSSTPSSKTKKKEKCTEQGKQEMAKEVEAIKNRKESEYSAILDKIASASTAEELETLSNSAPGEMRSIYDSAVVEVSNLVHKYNCLSFPSNQLSKLDNQIDSWLKKLTSTMENKLHQAVNDGTITEDQANQIMSTYNSSAKAAISDIKTIKQDFLKWGNEFFNGSGDLSCGGIFGEDVKKDIVEVLTWIRIAGPILVILLGSLDFAKAVFADDQEALKKATSTFVKRLIAAVALFFAPIIIEHLMDFAEDLIDGFGNRCDVVKDL